MKLTKSYRLIYSYDNVIQNTDNYKEKNTGVTELFDNYFQAKNFDSIGEMQKFIKEQKLTFKENEKNEITPFESAWENPTSKLRLFMSAFDCTRLAIDSPEFVMYLKQQNINLIPDDNYGGVWAYLEYILPEHREFLSLYNAKFEER